MACKVVLSGMDQGRDHQEEALCKMVNGRDLALGKRAMDHLVGAIGEAMREDRGVPMVGRTTTIQTRISMMGETSTRATRTSPKRWLPKAGALPASPAIEGAEAATRGEGLPGSKAPLVEELAYPLGCKETSTLMSETADLVQGVVRNEQGGGKEGRMRASGGEAIAQGKRSLLKLPNLLSLTPPCHLSRTLHSPLRCPPHPSHCLKLTQSCQHQSPSL